MRESISGIKNPKYKHGDKGTRLYNIWKDIKKRCTKPNSSNYKNYGAKGIAICNEWLDFIRFREWSEINGYADKLTIDRINVKDGYYPNNCRWVTMVIQNRNKSNNRTFFLDGESITMAEVCERYNITQSKLSARVNKLGWPIERAILNVNTKLGSNKTSIIYG